MTAIVLSCAGATTGDLCAARALGLRGVPVRILSSDPDAPSLRSRYVSASCVIPGLFDDPDRLLDALLSIRKALNAPPVVIPTADPDLDALITIGGRLQDVALSTVLEPALSKRLGDKSAFQGMAEAYGLPVPRTHSSFAGDPEATVRDIMAKLRFPVMIKPAQPLAWQAEAVPRPYRVSKAVEVTTPSDLLEHLGALGEARRHTLAQELVPGRDEDHFEVHAYIDRNGTVRGRYTGRKLRIEPPHAGSGCFVESVNTPELEEAALSMLATIGYRGIANMDFKRHGRTGAFELLEINPRLSQWSILATQSGVNIPYLAYLDARGAAFPELPRRRYGLRYMDERRDLSAAKQYRLEGTLDWPGYLRSLVKGPTIGQLVDRRDPGPMLSVAWQSIRARLRRLRKFLGGR